MSFKGCIKRGKKIGDSFIFLERKYLFKNYSIRSFHCYRKIEGS